MTTFFEDDFDGSATDPAKWENRDVDFGWGVPGSGDSLVVAGGRVQVTSVPGGTWGGERWCVPVPPTPDYQHVLRGVLLQWNNTTDSVLALVGVRVQNPAGYFTGWYVFVEKSHSHPPVWWLEKVDPDGNYHGQNYDTPPVSDGWIGTPPAFPCDVGISIVGNRVGVLFNGVEVFSVVDDGVTWGPLLTAAGVPYFYLGAGSGVGGAGLAAIERIEVNTPAPGDFWTDFENTAEFAAPVGRRARVMRIESPPPPPPVMTLQTVPLPALLQSPLPTPMYAGVWDQFCDHLSVASIEATLTNPANDNVTMHVRLLPLAAWHDMDVDDVRLPDWIYGSLCVGDTWDVYIALVNSANGPSWDSASSHHDIAAVPAYANWIAHSQAGPTYPAYYVTKVSAFDSNGVMHAPGVAVDGGQQYWDGTSLDPTVPMLLEVWFSTNPDAADQSKGYGGYLYYDDNGEFFECPDENAIIDEWRTGFFTVPTDVTSPSLTLEDFRAGIWMKRTGTNYNVRVIAMGVVMNEFNVASADTRFNHASNQFRFWENNTPVSDGWQSMEIEGYVQTTDESSPIYTLAIVANLFNCKRVIWVKPSPSNDQNFELSPQFTMLTDPAFAPPLSTSSLFWTDFDQTQEISTPVARGMRVLRVKPPPPPPVVFPPPLPVPLTGPDFVRAFFLAAPGTPIASYTGEVGGIWCNRRIEPPHNDETLSMVDWVVGDGTAVPVTLDYTTGDTAIFPHDAPTVADYFVEATFRLSNMADGSDEIYRYMGIELYARGTGTLMFGLESSDFFSAYVDSWSYIDTDRWKSLGSVERVQLDRDFGTLDFSNGEHRFRIEVEGMLLRVYWDDVLQLTNNKLTTLGSAGTSPGASGVSMYALDGATQADVPMTVFRVGPLPYTPLTTIGDFWTDFEKTQEFSA